VRPAPIHPRVGNLLRVAPSPVTQLCGNRKSDPGGSGGWRLPFLDIQKGTLGELAGAHLQIPFPAKGHAAYTHTPAIAHRRSIGKANG
jgi:hypothetical protein